MHDKKIPYLVLLTLLLCCMLCGCGEKTESEQRTLSLPSLAASEAAQPDATEAPQIDLSDGDSPRSIEIKPAETAAVKIG